MKIYTMTDLHRFLLHERACRRSIDWIDSYDWPSLEALWGGCENFRWMLWFCKRRGMSERRYATLWHQCDRIYEDWDQSVPHFNISKTEIARADHIRYHVRFDNLVHGW